MDIILFNASWMIYNILLALTAPFLGWFAYKLKQKFWKISMLVLWLIFIPNTLYVITDLIYIPRQWNEIENIEKIILILQYGILEMIGFFTFILGIYVFEKTLFKLKKKKVQVIISIILLNFLIGFGIVLGRIQRTNSWDIILDPRRTIRDFVQIISSTEWMLWVLFFGLFGNLLYFLFKEKIVKLLTKIF